MHRPFLLVSACLCGISCRYDGKSLGLRPFVRLAQSGLALPACPELLGGLGVPREPCEILGQRVLSRCGQDLTEAFRQGALKTLALAREHGIRTAVLKEKSHSCGSTRIYDGAFSGSCVPGRGIAADMLIKAGVVVYNEENCPEEFFGTAARAL